jgi:hypothetical protein
VTTIAIVQEKCIITYYTILKPLEVIMTVIDAMLINAYKAGARATPSGLRMNDRLICVSANIEICAGHHVSC